MKMKVSEKPICRSNRDLKRRGENKVDRAIELAFGTEEEDVITIGAGGIGDPEGMCGQRNKGLWQQEGSMEWSLMIGF